MPDNDLFREPDENSGPALMGREPVIAPQQRKQAIRRMRQMKGEMMERFGGDN